MLKNVTKHEEGWYTCAGMNTLGITFSKAYLEVIASNKNHDENDIENFSVGPEKRETTEASRNIIDEIGNYTQFIADDIVQH